MIANSSKKTNPRKNNFDDEVETPRQAKKVDFSALEEEKSF